MKKEKKEKIVKSKDSSTQEDLKIDKEYIEVGYITFKFPITRDEAEMVINQPKSQVARKMKTYMRKVLEAGCKRMLASTPDEDVKKCKLELEK